MMKHNADQTQSATTTATATTSKTVTKTLSGLEENIVRMRHGLTVPEEHQLDTKAGGNEALMAELMEIEQRALSEVGSRSNAAKRKIIGALRRK